MSSHTHTAEFEHEDASFEVEIDYDMGGDHHEYMVPGEPNTRCWIPGWVEVGGVTVLSVIDYDDGEPVSVVYRADMSDVARKFLDKQAAEYVDREIERDGGLLYELTEAAWEANEQW